MSDSAAGFIVEGEVLSSFLELCSVETSGIAQLFLIIFSLNEKIVSEFRNGNLLLPLTVQFI
jgi:hypothetical protein